MGDKVIQIDKYVKPFQTTVQLKTVNIDRFVGKRIL